MRGGLGHPLPAHRHRELVLALGRLGHVRDIHGVHLVFHPCEDALLLHFLQPPARPVPDTRPRGGVSTLTRKHPTCDTSQRFVLRRIPAPTTAGTQHP
eukprot:4334289-Pyramimonas_sp.AAC.1